MNVNEFTYLVNKPEAVHDKQTVDLEKIVQEFPYFQSARALYLKGLYNQNSFKYNYVLKVTAAHTADRSILFDFITSDTFTTIHKGLYEKKVGELLNITVKESEIVEPRLEHRENTIESSILSSIKEAENVMVEQWEEIRPDIALQENTLQIENSISDTDPDSNDPNVSDVQDIKENITSNSDLNQNDELIDISASVSIENLELGKPLIFSTEEKHSFQEWLQLSKITPIHREENETGGNMHLDEDLEKQKKNELIDRFIETSPKIPQVKHDSPAPPPIVFEPSQADNSYLMTETLARVYLEQKKYHKAIQAYDILILKYPEKSSFFADRILDIKILQKNNKQ